MNDRINSNLIDANIKLQDENDLLKIDKKMLETRIKKAIEDLEKTKEKNNKHILSRDNIVICLDIDHIDYLLQILKGEVIYD